MKAVPLGDVCTIVGGGTPRRNNEAYFGGAIPWATPTDVTALNGLSIARTKETITETGLRESSARLVPAGTILLTSRATIGHTAIAERPMATNQGFANFICGDRLVPEYLAYWLRGQRDRLIRLAGGTTFKEISKSTLKGIPIDLPPLAEQRRIANILNRVARIERLRAISTDYLYTFAPALFVKMFDDPVDNSMRWKISRLGDVANVVAGDPAPQNPKAFSSDGPLFVRMRDVGRDHLNPALSLSMDRLDPEWLGKNHLRLFPKDSVLIPKSGASVNLNHRAMLATDAYVVSHLAVVIPDRSKVEPDYLFWWAVRYDPRKQVQVTSLPSLKLSTLKSAEIPLPPLDEQHRFAGIIRQAIGIADNVKSASESASTLTASLMDRLLNGQPGTLSVGRARPDVT